MNHLKYLDTLLESKKSSPRWARIKNIKDGTVAPPDKPIPTLPGFTGLKFYASEHSIGERIQVTPFHDDPGYGYWRSGSGNMFHKSWLDFEDEEEPNLFTRDPKPAIIHWHSAGRM